VAIGLLEALGDIFRLQDGDQAAAYLGLATTATTCTLPNGDGARRAGC
jgi:hypothetical protein